MKEFSVNNKKYVGVKTEELIRGAFYCVEGMLFGYFHEVSDIEDSDDLIMFFTDSKCDKVVKIIMAVTDELYLLSEKIEI